MNSDNHAPTRWRKAGRLSVLVTSTMFGLSLAGLAGTPPANAIPSPDLHPPAATRAGRRWPRTVTTVRCAPATTLPM